MAGILPDSPPRRPLNRQPPEKQAFRGVCPHPGLILCTLLPLLGTLPTIGSPRFLSKLPIPNIVGYQQNAVPNGYRMVTPTFVTIDGAQYNIDDFVVSGAPDTMANICVMNAAGDWVGQYYWYNEFTDPGTGTVYPAGWFDLNGVEPAGVTLKAGDSVFFYTDQDNVTIQSAGQVPGVVTLNTPAGYTMVGNCSPVNLSIDDLTVTGAPDTMANICEMNAAGDWVGQYYWYNEFTDPGTGTVYPAGWFDLNGVEPAGITLNPGEAVFFYTDQSNVTVSIPSAL